jgi:uncharacterized sporulation protein YeaH/YhbH (DUF444 family)
MAIAVHAQWDRAAAAAAVPSLTVLADLRVPRAATASTTTGVRIMCLLDVSGSMTGAKLAQVSVQNVNL